MISQIQEMLGARPVPKGIQTSNVRTTQLGTHTKAAKIGIMVGQMTSQYSKMIQTLGLVQATSQPLVEAGAEKPNKKSIGAHQPRTKNGEIRKIINCNLPILGVLQMLQATKIATGALLIHQGITTRTDLTSEAGMGNVAEESSGAEETLEAEVISEAVASSEGEVIVEVAGVVVALTITRASEDAMTTVRTTMTMLGPHPSNQETTLGLKREQRQLEGGAQRRPNLKMITRILQMPGAKPK